jgi:hypothetical protein
MIRSIRLGLAALAMAAMSLLLIHPANAQTPVTCADAPKGLVTGNLIIVDTSSACNIPYSISATQNISIQASGPITITGSVTMPKPTSTSYGSIYINGQQSVKITGDLSATPTTDTPPGAGSIVIDAGGTLQAGTITTSLGGYIVVEAQKSGGTQPFVVGTSGTNGVGKLTTSGTNNGVFNYTLQASTLVYVSNGDGTASATGGITVTATSSIAIANGGGGRAGGLILNAQNGPLSIPGSITLAGTTNLVGGGYLNLLANSVTFKTTTTLNVSQNTSVNKTCYNTQIVISTATINYTTLTLNANGIGAPAGCGNDGSSTTYPAGVFLVSQNQLAIADTQTLDDNILSVLTIYVNPTGNPLTSLTMTGTGALSVTANGNTAEAVVRAYPFSITKGTTVSLSSTGSTDHGVYISNETAGTGQPGITFGNTGSVTLNASGLVTAGATTTAGGFIYVAGDQVALNAPTFVINANGPSGAGDGGIAYLSSTFLSTGSAFKGAKITANGSTAATGDAQSDLVVPALSPTTEFPAITIQGGTQSNLTFGNGTTLGTFNLAATGGKTGGLGGTVTVNAGNMTVQNVLSINASALATDSNAGSIILNSTNPTAPSVTFTYSTAPVIAVQAAGGTDSGLGGSVTVNVAKLSQTSTNFDVNGEIKVDGGTKLMPSQNDGSISLNGQLCQQTPTANAPVWPAAFWDCTAQTGLYQSPAVVTASNISATARGKAGLTTRLRIYVFNQIGNYTTFFLGSPPQEAGETFQANTTTDPNIYSSVWLQNPQTGNSFSDTTLREITIHEIGHGFDYFLGQSKQSGNATYNTFASNDFLSLDYAYVDPKSFTSPDNPGASVPRLPCALTPIAGTDPVQYYPGAIPFANVVDQNGVSICSGGALSPTYAASYTTNSALLQLPAVGQYFFTQTNGLWDQLYAQSLAYKAYAINNSPSLFAYVVPDNIYLNGYFACSITWAGAIQAGATTPPTDKACSAKLPDWYTF